MAKKKKADEVEQEVGLNDGNEIAAAREGETLKAPTRSAPTSVTFKRTKGKELSVLRTDKGLMVGFKSGYQSFTMELTERERDELKEIL